MELRTRRLDIALQGPDPWAFAFRATDRESGSVVGSCSFKGPPVDGVVEIAYGTEPEHEGKGYATEMARALVDYAAGSGEVRVVRAHTLPGAGASTRVLENCGFEFVGDTVDPEDGSVSRFERKLPSPFQQVRARYLVALWLIVPFFGVAALWRVTGGAWPWYWFEQALFWTYYGLVAAVSVPLVFGVWKLPVRACIGKFPTRTQFLGGIKLTVFVYLVASALLYAVFYPLSFIAPGFVQSWLVDLPPLLYEDGGTYPLLANILSLLTVCVMAPVFEEAMFRGLLLPRFSFKWGLRWGIFVSSAIFAVAHPDPVGAFTFAVAMCALYLRTQSLLLPMFCHGLYNLAVWVQDSIYTLMTGPGHVYTLEEFRAGWTWAALSGAIAVVWAIYYLSRPRSDVRWELPVN
jgi:membrane protease YdiL (CAAX protease family)